MKLSEFIKQYNISRPTFYRKLSEAKIDLSECRDADGNLTDWGLSRLADFMKEYQRTETLDVSETLVNVNADSDNDSSQVRLMKQQLADKDKEIESLRQEIERLNALMLQKTEEHSAQLAEIIKKEQALQEQRLLIESNSGGFLKRLFGKK